MSEATQTKKILVRIAIDQLVEIEEGVDLDRLKTGWRVTMDRPRDRAGIKLLPNSGRVIGLAAG